MAGQFPHEEGRAGQGRVETAHQVQGAGEVVQDGTVVGAQVHEAGVHRQEAVQPATALRGTGLAGGVPVLPVLFRGHQRDQSQVREELLPVR